MEESKKLWGEDDVRVLWLSFLRSFGSCPACGAALFAVRFLDCFLAVFAGRVAAADGGCS